MWPQMHPLLQCWQRTSLGHAPTARMLVLRAAEGTPGRGAPAAGGRRPQQGGRNAANAKGAQLYQRSMLADPWRQLASQASDPDLRDLSHKLSQACREQAQAESAAAAAAMAMPPALQSPLKATVDSEEFQKQLNRQLEYYFSASNLQKDAFLRAAMDREGWVTIATLATFPRVQTALGASESDVLDCLKQAEALTVSEDCKRVRLKKWRRWLQPLADAASSSKGLPGRGGEPNLRTFKAPKR